MGRKLIILILALFINSVVINTTLAETPLRDGFVLSGIQGKLIRPDSNESSQNQPINLDGSERWFFSFDSDVTDAITLARAGTTIELLPSAGLEKMVADAGKIKDAGLTLYNGVITTYKGRNYIFPTFFLQHANQVEPASKPAEKPKAPAKPKISVNEPNDEFTIPQEIINKLRNSKKTVVRPAQLGSKGFKLKQNSIIVDKSGYIVKQPGNRVVFIFDAVGRNFSSVSISLLPCQVLELAQQKQAEAPEQIRFKISGILTAYKDKNYLLLQKATRIYSYGNFER
jgi:hypothetical protein